MAAWEAILAGAERVLVVDWPTREVPDSLARAGLEVTVHGGPEPDHYVAYEVEDGEVVERWVGQPPEAADLVYSYRPVDELPEIVETARGLGAKAVWVELSDAAERARAREIVDSAGLVYVDEPSIVEAAAARGTT